MSTKVGKQGEAAAAVWLMNQGHSIIFRNWRTRYCEIDIITKKKNTFYFVEVKYRNNSRQGDGLDYITTNKLKQMQFASEFFMAKYKLTNQHILCALSVGRGFEVLDFLEIQD